MSLCKYVIQHVARKNNLEIIRHKINNNYALLFYIFTFFSAPLKSKRTLIAYSGHYLNTTLQPTTYKRYFKCINWD